MYVPEHDEELEELREEIDFYQIETYKKAIDFKEFQFASMGDSNGYLYWLGTKQGKEAWTNPHNMLSVTAVKGGFHSGPGSVTTRGVNSQLGICSNGEGTGFSIRLPNAVRAALPVTCNSPRVRSK